MAGGLVAEGSGVLVNVGVGVGVNVAVERGVLVKVGGMNGVLDGEGVVVIVGV
jgi:hypothetical protein